MNKIVECVPNFSEGRDLQKIDRIVAPFRGKQGVKLLDYSNDEDHNGLVVTVVGEPEPLRDAVLEAIGVGTCGGPGTTAALAMLNDAVKKGGVFASSHVGGLSGAFIPVSEDSAIEAAARSGALTMEKLEAMTCVCSVGLDMIAIPGDTPAETISAMIADEAAIGMINSKTTAVRIIPVPGKTVGDVAVFGGLLGEASIIRVPGGDSQKFIDFGGRIPAPIHSLRN